jgi:hypothetical protein
MPAVALAPYLPLRESVGVGPWELVPFRMLGDAPALPHDLRRPVTRLVDAYTVPSGGLSVMGALLYPAAGAIGSHFEPSALGPLRRALLAGVIANNPYMAVKEDEQDPNAGYAVGTTENAALWGHPLTDGDSYVIDTGVLASTRAYHSAEPDEPLPLIPAPIELPSSMFGNFDHEVADATHNVITSEGLASRRLRRALDWYLIAFSNAEAVTLDVRVGAARSAVEVLTGAGDGSKKIVRAFGRLLDDEGAPTETRKSVIWTRGGEQVPVQLTSHEWWMARLCELRNAIVHGDEVPDELWTHDGHHHLNHAHDRLIDCLLATLAAETTDPLFRLRGGDRVLARLAHEMDERLRDLGDAEDGD